MEDMIMVLGAFRAPGSELMMFNDVPENEREKKLIDGGLDFSRLENIQLVNREEIAVIRRHLESLPLHSFDSAIQADSRSLATLLLIRDIQQASDKSVIISEILDPRTKNLLCTSKISDYVLSNEIVSMALAMVAEDQQINDVLEELFAEEDRSWFLAKSCLREDIERTFNMVMTDSTRNEYLQTGFLLRRSMFS